jgi:hypothetical protein
MSFFLINTMIYCCTKSTFNQRLSQKFDNIFVTHLFKLLLISCRLLKRYYGYGSLFWGSIVGPPFNGQIGVRKGLIVRVDSAINFYFLRRVFLLFLFFATCLLTFFIFSFIFCYTRSRITSFIIINFIMINLFII